MTSFSKANKPEAPLDIPVTDAQSKDLCPPVSWRSKRRYVAIQNMDAVVISKLTIQILNPN